ncbi:probable LRR receptor-like serine/threonine-protein kinase isoform X2 [Tanacetum coccineum]
MTKNLRTYKSSFDVTRLIGRKASTTCRLIHVPTDNLLRVCSKDHQSPVFCASPLRINYQLKGGLNGTDCCDQETTREIQAKVIKKIFTSSVVGRGGYGKFYKGILGDGQWYLLNVQKKDRYKMLVYEFSSRGTLRDWLNRMKLLRLEILNFTVFDHWIGQKGILYLRTEANPPIFHRDNKTSNILIDSKLTAKVADLGLSRLAPLLDDYGVGPNYVSTVVRGTPGYLDPKFLSTHKLTRESDVYSLGVVLLEIMTSMKPILHGKNIVRELVSLTLWRCNDKPEKRPSMLDVVQQLEHILEKECTPTDRDHEYGKPS